MVLYYPDVIPYPYRILYVILHTPVQSDDPVVHAVSSLDIKDNKIVRNVIFVCLCETPTCASPRLEYVVCYALHCIVHISLHHLPNPCCIHFLEFRTYHRGDRLEDLGCSILHIYYIFAPKYTHPCPLFIYKQDVLSMVPSQRYSSTYLLPSCMRSAGSRGGPSSTCPGRRFPR